MNTPDELQAHVETLKKAFDQSRTRNRTLTVALREAEAVLSELLVTVRAALASATPAAAVDRKPGTTFEIPAGTRAAKCRSCQDEIFWIKTSSGKSMPCNADGTSHFSTCPQANDHRKPRGGA